MTVPTRTEKGQKRSHSKPSADVDFSLLRDFRPGKVSEMTGADELEQLAREHRFPAGKGSLL